MSTIKKIAVAFFTLTATVLSLQLLWFHDWRLTFCVVASIVLHELGHAVFLAAYGVKIGMFFVPFLGAAVTMDNKAFTNLTFRQKAFVALAGPFFNVLLVAVGLALLPNPEISKYGVVLIGLNLSLTYFNLIPLGVFDGKILLNAIFESLNEEEDRFFALAFGVLTTAAGTIMVLVGKMGIPFVLIFWFWLVCKESTQDDPANAHSPKAMGKKTAVALLVVFTILLVGSAIAGSFVPNWTEIAQVWPAK